MSSANRLEHMQTGLALHREILAEPWLGTWTREIHARYETLEAARRRDGPLAPSALMSPGQRFLPTASSFTLGEIFSGGNLRILLAGILAGPAGAWTRGELNGSFVCDIDQSWIRRQYAPANYPQWHAPHGWHQDGALGFDFMSRCSEPGSEEGILNMVTCWISLGACGADAPGLEFVTRRTDEVFQPGELAESNIRGRFDSSEFWQPELKGGDALLFRGDLLHRTHVEPEMTRDRTSLELRFFPAGKVPARLRDDRLIPTDYAGDGEA